MHTEAFDDCIDMEDGYECTIGYDHDGDNETDDWDYWWFDYEQCEWSEDPSSESMSPESMSVSDSSSCAWSSSVPGSW